MLTERVTVTKDKRKEAKEAGGSKERRHEGRKEKDKMNE